MVQHLGTGSVLLSRGNVCCFTGVCVKACPSGQPGDKIRAGACSPTVVQRLHALDLSAQSYDHHRSGRTLNPELFTSLSLSAAAGFPRKRAPCRHRTFSQLFRPTRPAAGSRFRFPTLQMAWVEVCSPSLRQHLAFLPFSGGASMARPRHSRFPAPVAIAAARCFKAGETVRAVAEPWASTGRSVSPQTYG